MNYTSDDFTSSRNLCYINEHGEMLHQTPMHELFNLRWFIQHLMDESEDENENPLSHGNWMKQTNWKFIEYVIHHKHSMTPEQRKQKPLKEIIMIQHEKLDREEEESNENEEESTTSSDMSEQDSEYDTTTDDDNEASKSTIDEQESEHTETLQIHNVCNTTMHDEDN